MYFDKVIPFLNIDIFNGYTDLIEIYGTCIFKNIFYNKYI